MSGQEAARSRKWHAEQEILYTALLSKSRFKPIGGDSDGRGMNELPQLKMCHGHSTGQAVTGSNFCDAALPERPRPLVRVGNLLNLFQHISLVN
jgi:hypothetical protein